MFTNYIQLALVNFGFVLFFIATVVALIHKLARWRMSTSEIVYRWYALFALGFTALYAAYMHAADPVYTAALLGWVNSPFQFEVAMANLGFGLIAVLSFNATYGFRLATVIGNTCWLWGDAVGHIHQMIIKNNFSIGNASSWFWLDIFVPVILLLCLVSIKKKATS